MPAVHKNCKKKMNLSYYDRSHGFSKNTVIFMVFFTYKYLNVEAKHLKIKST